MKRILFFAWLVLVAGVALASKKSDSSKRQEQIDKTCGMLRDIKDKKSIDPALLKYCNEQENKKGGKKK